MLSCPELPVWIFILCTRQLQFEVSAVVKDVKENIHILDGGKLEQQQETPTHTG